MKYHCAIKFGGEEKFNYANFINEVDYAYFKLKQNSS